MDFPSYCMSLDYLQISFSIMFSLQHNLNQIFLPFAVAHDILKDLQLLKVNMLIYPNDIFDPYCFVLFINLFKLNYEIRHFTRPSIFFNFFICLEGCLCFIF